MRIVFLAPEYPPFGFTGGIGSYVSLVAPTLALRGSEVHVICSGANVFDFTDREVMIHVRPFSPIPFLRSSRRLSQTLARLAAARTSSRALREIEKPDVIESPEWMAQSLFVRGETRRLRLVVHLHSPVGLIAYHGGRLGRDAKVAHWLEMSSIKGARAITSPSRMLLDLTTRRSSASGTQRVIRLPVDLAGWPARNSRSPTDRVVLVVGRLERLKGIDILLHAVAALPQRLRDAKVLAVGRSSGLHEGRPYGDWLSDLADDLGVFFERRGEISPEDLRREYAQARVVALPSRFDSFGMVALEAMASGLPVVCSSACGCAELIEGSDAGTVFPNEDVLGLRDALVTYLDDEDAATRAGVAARDLVESECAPDVIAGQREAMYREISFGAR